MPTDTILTLYTFDELDQSAKETARNWYREGIDSDDIANTDDWESVAEILGIAFATRSVQLYGGGTRQEPKVWWTGFYSQGDGASFEGSYSYAKGASKRIREYAPQATALHRIADDLQRVQAKHFYQLCATIKQGGHYYHSGTMSVDVERADGKELASGDWDRSGVYRPADAEEVVTQAMRDFADWIYSQLEAENDYRNSDEVVDEEILANGYTFEENGKRRD